MRSAGKAAIWVAFSKWLGLLSGLVSLVVVARLLTPEDFGVYGFLLIVLVIPEVFSSDSLNEVLIQRTDLKTEHSNSVFLSSLCFAALFFGLIQLSAPYIAVLFDVPPFRLVTITTQPMHCPRKSGYCRKHATQAKTA